MNRVTPGHYIQRIRTLGVGGSISRLTARIVSAITNAIDSVWWGYRGRRGMSDGVLFKRLTLNIRSTTALRDHYANRISESFLLPHTDGRTTLDLLYTADPTYTGKLLNEADAIVDGVVHLLGCDFQLDKLAYDKSSTLWHTDPVSGLFWPLLTRGRMDHYLWDSAPPADPKLIWELNRHQYLLKLALAAHLTGDDTYIRTADAHITSWITANPINRGINWYSSLEIGLRLISWALIFQFVRRCPEFKGLETFLKSLYQQADYLLHHLSTNESVPNNHLIGEATALVIVGAVFPEFDAAATWKATGLRHLTAQASAQTHPDGLNKEQATGYHRFVVEFLLLVRCAARRGLIKPQPQLDDILARMLEATCYLVTPDGNAPMWGDADDGSAHGLTPPYAYWSLRDLLAVGAVTFQQTEWKYVAGHFSVEAAWLTGPCGYQSWDMLAAAPAPTYSRAFEAAGVYVLRDQWTSDADVAMLRAGPFGLGEDGPCSHAHCDLLAVQLWIDGRALLVDSGTYSYFAPERNHFRLTAAHNTLVIDGQEQAEPGDAFSWLSIPTATLTGWTPGERVSGCLYTTTAVQARELTHIAHGHWRLTDCVHGQPGTHVTWHFHLAPELGAEYDAKEAGWRLRCKNDITTWLFPPDTVEIHTISGWHSRHYRHRTPNTVLVAQSWLPASSTGTFVWDFMLTHQINRKEAA
ncbi:MAG: heparinase II/III family protein [Chloroflexota bacterium]